MSEQIKKNTSSDPVAESDGEFLFKRPDTKDIDIVIEEIDAILEKNADEFVKGFIQKGGQ